jgi:phosphatidylinositol alpha-1,6-mannosyltransferase
MLKIAMLAADPIDAHGWGRYARDMITALAAQGLSITLITSTHAPEDPKLPLAGYHRILPSVTASPPERMIRPRLLAMRPQIKQVVQGCDLIHVLAEPYMLGVGGLAPVVVTAHGTYIPRTVADRVFGRMYRNAYMHAQILCVSRFTAEMVSQVLPKAKLTVVHNGVDSDRFLQKGPSPAKTGTRILAVGQMKPRKGFHLLAKALPQILKTHPNAEVIAIGSMPLPAYVAEIRQQLQADGTTHAMQILGRVEDSVILDWYHQADLFALPAANLEGSFEGFGLVYLEASAAGLPTIGTWGCGAEEAIVDGQTGLLIPQNDPDRLAEAITQLLDDSALRQRLGEAGIAYAVVHDWRHAAEQVIALYAEQLALKTDR